MKKFILLLGLVLLLFVGCTTSESDKLLKDFVNKTWVDYYEDIVVFNATFYDNGDYVELYDGKQLQGEWWYAIEEFMDGEQVYIKYKRFAYDKEHIFLLKDVKNNIATIEINYIEYYWIKE